MFSSYSGIVSGSVFLLFLSTALTISAQFDELLASFQLVLPHLIFLLWSEYLEWFSLFLHFFMFPPKLDYVEWIHFFPFLHHFILFSSAADVVLSIMLVSQQPFY